MSVHPTAIIHPSAQVASGVEIGPYAIIEEQVTIGAGTVIGPHAVIGKWTQIGENNHIFHLASVGAPPQDLKYKGEECWTRIGNGNVIREFATIHRGTTTGHRETVIGNNNLFMSYSHVAHDCVVGNGNVFANSATLAGMLRYRITLFWAAWLPFTSSSPSAPTPCWVAAHWLVLIFLHT